jgi:hypothetical protein
MHLVMPHDIWRHSLFSNISRTLYVAFVFYFLIPLSSSLSSFFSLIIYHGILNWPFFQGISLDVVSYTTIMKAFVRAKQYEKVVVFSLNFFEYHKFN